MDWTEGEQTALANFFLGSDSALKNALVKFTEHMASADKAQCAALMASVPRDPERAADYAAKAQRMDEFWTLLTELLLAEQQPVGVPLSERPS